MRSTGSVFQHAPTVRLHCWSGRRFGRVFLDARTIRRDPGRAVAASRLYRVESTDPRPGVDWAAGHLRTASAKKRPQLEGLGPKSGRRRRGWSGIIQIGLAGRRGLLNSVLEYPFCDCEDVTVSQLGIMAHAPVSSLAVGVRAVRHRMIPIALIEMQFGCTAATCSGFRLSDLASVVDNGATSGSN
jgi:hypothetical protein